MNAFVASELDIRGNVVSRRVVSSDRICSISVESASPSVARAFMKNGDAFTLPVEGRLKELIEGKWPPPPKPYDAEVQWLESTGTQYVDSGIDAAMDVRMSTDAVSLHSGSVQFHAMGFFATGELNASYALFCSDKGMIQAAVGNSNNRISAAGVNWNTRHTVELDHGELLVDSTSYGFPGSVPTSLAASNRIYVCGLNGVALHPGRWYGAKIYKNGTLVRDYIPVRVGTTGYLYDRANPTGGPFGNGLYGSATDTPLIAGPDVGAT